MVQKKDINKTRERLLDAACDIFGRRGYRDTRVVDICRRAGTNAAAVNYYFGGKAPLYVAAWQQAFKKDVIPDMAISADASPEDRLGIIILALIRKFCDRGARGQFSRMYLMELANPTGLIDEDWRQLVEPRRRNLLGIIREMVGPDTANEKVVFCELSIINQCRAFLIPGRSDLEYLVQRPLTPKLIQKLADHITRFSIAGIRAMIDRQL
ncbi:MAG: CerR family C-terminal domain-containing protein [Pseudomonadota bacterium]